MLPGKCKGTQWSQRAEQVFFRLDQNKTELFRFLSKTMISLGREGETLVFAYDDTCISSNGDLDLSNVKSCNHEEVDSRAFLHVKDMVKQGHRKMVIRMCWY